MIYGAPTITIEDDQTDRIGIRTLVLSLMWQPSRWPMPFADLAAEAPGIPPVPGGLAFIGHQVRRRGGALRSVWTFEGINGDGKSVTFKGRGNSPDFRFEPGFAQVSVLQHPNFTKELNGRPALREKYEGTVYEGEVFWPDTIGESAAAGLGGGSSKPANNPMFGVQTFLRMEGTYSFRYAARDLTGAQDDVGKIHSGGLPGNAPKYKDRNWLKAPSTYIHRSKIYDITEVYWLSGEGGWPAPLYEKAGKSAEPQDQLTSTGLGDTSRWEGWGRAQAREGRQADEQEGAQI